MGVTSVNSEISTLIAAVAAVGGAIVASLTFIDRRVAAAVKPLQMEINELRKRIDELESCKHAAHVHVVAAHGLAVKGGHDDITKHLIAALEALT